MRSDLPKVLHPLGGVPMLRHAIASGAAVKPSRTIVVAGHKAEVVREALADFAPEAEVVLQTEQLGTAHAVDQARTALEGASGDAFVLYGDTPFIRNETLSAMKEARSRFDVVILGFEAADPARYGRLIEKDGALEAIVEWKDATEDQRAVTLCNSGVVCADQAVLFDLIAAVGNDNAAGEYYLTDIVAIARAKGLTAGVVRCPEEETLGIDSKVDLAEAESIWQNHRRQTALEAGVTMAAPHTVFFHFDTTIAPDAVIEPNVVFGPGVSVAAGAQVRAFSHLEGAKVGPGAVVGPYARLRPGAEIGPKARVGNFVEIKNAELSEGAKANHLTYVGDATVGAGANLGAGTVTCNYDGVFKHRTEIGAGAFIGSSTMLVAPVSIGDHAMTASGSVITKDVPEGALAVGRADQTIKQGLGKRLMDKLRARKATQKKD